MKKIKIDRRAAKVLGFAVAAVMSSQLHAQTSYTWDASASNPGTPQDGPGTWNLTTKDWTTNGTSDVIWPNSTSDNAYIGSDHTAVSGVQDITMGAVVTLGNLTFGALNGGSSTTYYDIVAATGANSNMFTLGMTGSTPTVTVNSGVFAEIDAPIQVTGSQPDLTVAGSGTLYMNPAAEGSSYHGLIFGGTSTTVLLSSAAVPIAIPNNNTAATFDGGTLVFDFSGSSATDISGRISETGSSAVNIGVEGGAVVSFANPIGGSGGLNVSGSGSGSTLELTEGSGSNVGYSGTGTVTVNGGTLYLHGNNNNEFSNSNPVVVNSGGTLSSDSTKLVTAGNATVTGQVTGGSGALSTSTFGNIHLTSGSATTTFNSGGTYVWKLNLAPSTAYHSGSTVNSVMTGGSLNGNSLTNFDTLFMSNLTASSGFGVDLVTEGTSNLTAGTTYKFAIANVTGTYSVSSFVLSGASGFSVAEAADNTLSSAELDGGTGDDLILSYTPTPEPTSLLLGGLAISPLMLARRRRRLALVCDA
jgi:hypothetical protein